MENEKTMYIEVIIDNKGLNTDILYTYRVPKDLEDKIYMGRRVLVPFGKGNKLKEALIINKIWNFKLEGIELKEIEYIIDKEEVLSKTMIELLKWMRKRYLCSYGDILRVMLPIGLFLKSKKIVIRKKCIDLESIKIGDILNSKEIVDLDELTAKFSKKEIKSEIAILQKLDYIQIDIEIKNNIEIKYLEYIVKNFNSLDKAIDSLNKNAYKQIELLRELENTGLVLKIDMIKKLKTTNQVVKSLEKKGYLKIRKVESYRNPSKEKVKNYDKIILNEEQKRVYDKISESFNNKESKSFLIHGITGSGKTEIYLQLIENILKQGKNALVLVPEIALTPQTLERFMGRFGNTVGIIHSRLSYGERFDQWRRIKSGDIKVVVGTRSAIFSPIENLGIIIIDEEHDSSYKSSKNPKFDTIEVAKKLVELNCATLVLGSATPSIVNYSNLDIEKLNIDKRANGNPLPDVLVVDMKEELKNGNKTIFSSSLYKGIKEKLKKKEQILLFLNSRGYSKTILCRNCGYVYKCKNCDVSLNFHKDKNKGICHYCGLTEDITETCPNCNSKYIKHIGIGTEKIEEQLRSMFPDAKVLRIDADTVKGKNTHKKLFEEIKENKVDIIIGTQMITKGLDFPRVTLVGVIIADLSLNIPDYKSGEVTFQLLTQVAGRAGREKLKGQVIVQTYKPEHYSLEMSKNYNYMDFYNYEMTMRKEFNYPPFCEIITATFIGKSKEDVDILSLSFKEELDQILKPYKSSKCVEIFGPMEALVYRRENKFRIKLIIKIDKNIMSEVSEIIKNLVLKNLKAQRLVYINLDINPSFIY